VSAVTVAIPTRNGGRLLGRVLDALARQTVEHELLVCDSGSRDGSPALARARGARVIEIQRREFSHGGTRNLMMDESSGAHVAFLTQDAEPADERWLERLLEGFKLAGDIAVTFGPYRARPGAPLATRVELGEWFASLAPDGRAHVQRLAEHERIGLPARELMGRRGFLTDANACLARSAWERVPFREVPYAEDRALAVDLLRAGYAKAYIPDAAVFHSHTYTTRDELRRSFDESRGLREIYGWCEPAHPAILARNLRGALGPVQRELHQDGASPSRMYSTLAAAGARGLARLGGAVLGSRADRLAPGVRRALSLEGRASFIPLDLDLDRATGPDPALEPGRDATHPPGA
jgi:rhamnosyltransferase